MIALPRQMLQSYVRYFPWSSGKAQLIRLLWKPLSLGRHNGTTTLRGSNVRMSCDLTKLIQRQLYFWGTYEADCCNLWVKLAAKSKVIFDLGANVGLYSLLAAEANPRSSITAFEPTIEMVDLCLTNISLNSFKNIDLIQAAVGAETGSTLLRE
jgi:hypothetical protein